MTKTLTEIRSLARSHTRSALKALVGVMQCKDATPAARVSAANAILDRGWGKPPQAHTGEENEGKIRVTIRHISEGRDGAPRTIEHEAKQIEVAQNDEDEP